MQTCSRTNLSKFLTLACASLSTNCGCGANETIAGARNTRRTRRTRNTRIRSTRSIAAADHQAAAAIVLTRTDNMRCFFCRHLHLVAFKHQCAMPQLGPQIEQGRFAHQYIHESAITSSAYSHAIVHCPTAPVSEADRKSKWNQSNRFLSLPASTPL